MIMQSKNIDMTKGNDCGLILRFSAPLVAGNLFQQVYSLTDAVIVGKFIGVNALAAVGCSSWITWLLFGICRDSANAFCIAASKRIGAKNYNMFKLIAANSALFGIVLAVISTTVLLVFLDPILSFLKVQSDIYADARWYLLIFTLSTPMIIAYDMAAALLHAVGNSRCSFDAMLISTLVNITLDIIFVAILHAGVPGAALATFVAQAVSTGIVLRGVIRKEPFRTSHNHWRFNGAILKETAMLWIPMFWNTIIIAVGGILVQKEINGHGTSFTGGISAGTKIFNLIEAVIMAIQAGTCIYIGQNLGAGNIRRVRSGLQHITFVAEALTFAMIALTWLFGDELLTFLMSSSNPAIYQAALTTSWDFIRTLSLGMLIMTPMYLHRGAIQTLGHAVYPMIAGCMQLIARVAAIWLLPPVLGDFAYYLPDIGAWAVSLPIVYFPYIYWIRRLHKTQNVNAAGSI